ncbi:MAG: M20/M25/M40 family metallo-hydrolase [Nitriliruptor sp.]|nr:MAG: M20/M25/M40 family metallo-hydrolase [Nitriliruptor sp.]
MEGLELLRELVRVPSVNPPGDGEGAVAELLRDRLDGSGLGTQILASPAGRPSLVARLPGRPDRPPLVLLSHTDVVPVERGRWRHDPFGGEIIAGELWGRGTLDMKGVAVMHAEAVVALASRDREPDREVIVVAVADEEAGGGEGAGWLVADHGDQVGFTDGRPQPEVLGEGGFGLSGIVARPLMPIVVGEKAPLRFRARATGTPGHGSLPPERQAIRELARFVEKVSGPRRARLHPVMREQFAALAGTVDGIQGRLFGLLSGPNGHLAVRALAPQLRSRAGAIGHLISDTITPTEIHGGYKNNVVPGEAEVSFDARLLPDTDADALLRELGRIGRRHDIEVEEIWRSGAPASPRSSLFDVLAAVSSRLPGNPVPVASLTPGATDLRFFRARGSTAYGWVPLVLSPELLATFHGDDERIPVDGFATAVSAMTEVVTAAAS